MEQIRENADDDVETILLYPEDADPQQVFTAAEKLRENGNVLAVSRLPENLRWRNLYTLKEGEAIQIENNG